jgi:hypothetical protein
VLSQVVDWNTNKNIEAIFEGDNQHYNMTRERADKFWKRYQDYFNTFDIIITSDTAPLSRILLQNNWNKPLIIWVCNRFDYAHGGGSGFPDNEFYQLFKNAASLSNVKIVGYTAFENLYCKMRNIDVGNLVITPCGGISETYNKFFENKSLNNTFFIPPYHNDTIMMNLTHKINELGFKAYSGRYDGPMDLLNYKAVIHIPYAWSNLAFFEMFSLGIVYFIPSSNFIKTLRIGKYFYWSPPYIENYLEISEWYNKEHSEYLIYFDSWDDLILKINTLDFEKHKLKLKTFGSYLEIDRLFKWRLLFQ